MAVLAIQEVRKDVSTKLQFADSRPQSRSSRVNIFRSSESRSSSNNSSKSSSPERTSRLPFRKNPSNRARSQPKGDNGLDQVEEPILYLVIHNNEPKESGTSIWRVVICMPEKVDKVDDFLFDIVPDQRIKEGFRIREERAQHATLKSKFFRTTIKVGTIPTKGCTLDRVIHEFKSYKLDSAKKAGMGVIWVYQTIEQLKRIGEIQMDPRADQQIEAQVACLEKKRRA